MRCWTWVGGIGTLVFSLGRRGEEEEEEDAVAFSSNQAGKSEN